MINRREFLGIAVGAGEATRKRMAELSDSLPPVTIGGRASAAVGYEQGKQKIRAAPFRVGNTRMMVEFVVDEAGVTQVMGSGFQQMLARLEPKR